MLQKGLSLLNAHVMPYVLQKLIYKIKQCVTYPITVAVVAYTWIQNKQWKIQ